MSVLDALLPEAATVTEHFSMQFAHWGGGISVELSPRFESIAKVQLAPTTKTKATRLASCRSRNGFRKAKRASAGAPSGAPMQSDNGLQSGRSWQATVLSAMHVRQVRGRSFIKAEDSSSVAFAFTMPISPVTSDSPHIPAGMFPASKMEVASSILWAMHRHESALSECGASVSGKAIVRVVNYLCVCRCRGLTNTSRHECRSKLPR
jgi:hypothetical protein